MTARSVALGFILLAGITLLITYNDYAYANTYLSGGNHFPIAAVFVLVMLSLVVNPLLRRRSPSQAFSQGEAVTIWCIVAAGIGIPASGLMRYLLPAMVAPFYFAGSGDRWAEVVHPHIPAWLVPSKDMNSPIVRMFYEGTRGAAVPWQAWVVPFFGWGIVIMASYLMMFCLTAIIRKQWVEHERLSFPLAQIPLEITRPPEEGRLLNGLFRSPAMWQGAAIPIVFWLLAGLHFFYPRTPYILNVNWLLSWLLEQMKGWQGLFILYFMPVGVSFLLTTEVSLSLWLFFMINNVQRIVRNNHGYVDDGVYTSRQQIGGFIAFAGLTLWMMRHHLKDVFWKAFLGADDVDDSREALPYRAAVIGLAAAVAVITGWLALIGCPVPISLLFIAIVLVILLVLSRFVAQSGLLLVQTTLPSGPLSVVQDLAGDALVTTRGMTAITLHQAALYGDTREVLMPTLLNNSKMGENRLNLRKLFATMMVAAVIAYSISYFSQVFGYYRFGANVINTYGTVMYPRNAMDRVVQAAASPKESIIRRGGLNHMLIGAAAVLIVSFLRMRFAWWFVHPIGILTAQTYPIQQMWLGIFIGWLCKSLAQRYLRGPLMTTARHFFLGIIIGDVIITIFWAAIGLTMGSAVGIRTFPG